MQLSSCINWHQQDLTYIFLLYTVKHNLIKTDIVESFAKLSQMFADDC